MNNFPDLSLSLILSAIYLILDNILTCDESQGPYLYPDVCAWSGRSCLCVSASVLVPRSSPLASSLVGRNGLGSIRSLSEGRNILTLTALIPDMSCHWENVGGFLLDGLTVSKKLLNWMWNCGETNPVYGFSIKATDDAYIGECTSDANKIFYWKHFGWNVDWSNVFQIFWNRLTIFGVIRVNLSAFEIFLIPI